MGRLFEGGWAGGVRAAVALWSRWRRVAPTVWGRGGGLGRTWQWQLGSVNAVQATVGPERAESAWALPTCCWKLAMCYRVLRLDGVAHPGLRAPVRYLDATGAQARGRACGGTAADRIEWLCL